MARKIQWVQVDGMMTASFDGYFAIIEQFNGKFVAQIFSENDLGKAKDCAAYCKNFLRPISISRRKQYVTDAVLWAHQRVAKLVEQRAKGMNDEH